LPLVSAGGSELDAEATALRGEAGVGTAVVDEGSTTLLQLIRSDYHAAQMRPITALTGVLTLSPFWLVFLYRVSHWLHSKRLPLVPAIVRSIGVVLYGADLSRAARIGPRFRIVHGVGIVLGWDVVAGPGLTVCQNVTVGGRGHWEGERWTPTLGTNVLSVQVLPSWAP
jgi:serine O-acetyltransferase